MGGACMCMTFTWGHRRGPGPWFNIKMTSYRYRKSHCGDKTVVRSSYLHNGISYTGKMTSLYWIRVQNTCLVYILWACSWLVCVIIVNIFFVIYVLYVVQLTHSSLGDWKDTLVNHLCVIITINLSHYCHIFLWWCVSEVVAPSYSVNCFTYTYISSES